MTRQASLTDVTAEGVSVEQAGPPTDHSDHDTRELRPSPRYYDGEPPLVVWCSDCSDVVHREPV